MTRSLFVAFLVVARLAAGGVEQGAGVAKDEAMLAELEQVLAKAWVRKLCATSLSLPSPSPFWQEG